MVKIQELGQQAPSSIENFIVHPLFAICIYQATALRSRSFLLHPFLSGKLISLYDFPPLPYFKTDLHVQVKQMKFSWWPAA